jgi:hypothetical protein
MSEDTALAGFANAATGLIHKLALTLPDATTRDAIQTLMATHGHTLTPEQRAAVRGWLGRVA